MRQQNLPTGARRAPDDQRHPRQPKAGQRSLRRLAGSRQGLAGSHISRAHCCSSAASLPAAPWLTSSKQHLHTVAGRLSAVRDPDAVPGACKLAVRSGIQAHREGVGRQFRTRRARPLDVFSAKAITVTPRDAAAIGQEVPPLLNTHSVPLTANSHTILKSRQVR